MTADAHFLCGSRASFFANQPVIPSEYIRTLAHRSRTKNSLGRFTFHPLFFYSYSLQRGQKFQNLASTFDPQSPLKRDGAIYRKSITCIAAAITAPNNDLKISPTLLQFYTGYQKCKTCTLRCSGLETKQHIGYL